MLITQEDGGRKIAFAEILNVLQVTLEEEANDSLESTEGLNAKGRDWVSKIP